MFYILFIYYVILSQFINFGYLQNFDNPIDYNNNNNYFYFNNTNNNDLTQLNELQNTEHSSKFYKNSNTDIYSKCDTQLLSLSCLQKKLMVFLNQLNKFKNYGVIDQVEKIEEKGILVTPHQTRAAQQQSYWSKITDNIAEKFFDKNIVNLDVPEFLTGDSNNVFEIDLETPKKTGRGHVKKLKKFKKLKRFLMAMGVLALIKLAMLIPLSMALIKFKAIKAIFLSILSILISKMKLMGHKMNFSHGGGDHKRHDRWDNTKAETETTTMYYGYYEKYVIPNVEEDNYSTIH